MANYQHIFQTQAAPFFEKFQSHQVLHTPNFYHLRVAAAFANLYNAFQQEQKLIPQNDFLSRLKAL